MEATGPEGPTGREFKVSLVLAGVGVVGFFAGIFIPGLALEVRLAALVVGAALAIVFGTRRRCPTHTGLGRPQGSAPSRHGLQSAQT
jgi:hypothetical protein